MKFAEMAPSKQWAVFKFRGQKFAEVWFKPEGDPLALIFRVPRASFQIPDMIRQLSLENLLKAIGVAPQEVDTWRHDDVTHSGMNGSNPDIRSTFPVPPENADSIEIHVRLNSPTPLITAEQPHGEQPPAPVMNESAPVEEISPARWQELDARWKAIVGLEASLDTLRIGMEALLTEMEGATKKSLSMEEKNHALRADVARWTKAKSRVQIALPKLRDFIHRSIWAMGAPERKRLEELYKDHIQPQIPFADSDGVLRQLEQLQKDRQVLTGQGKTVHQESKAISTDVNSALISLQNNANANAQRKRQAGKGGKFMKDIRKMSGL